MGFITYLQLNRVYEKKLDTKIFEKKDFQAFEKYTKKNGAQNAYQALKNYFKNNDPQAHDFAHVVGIVNYEKNGESGLGICDTAYNYGCTHGFIEAYLAKNGIDLVGKIENSCQELGPLHAPSCLHGIGHGLMMNASYILGSALENCQKLQESSWIYCFDGVFMERIVGSMQDSADKLQINTQNLDEPCKSLEQMYQDQCWRNQVTLWFQYFQNRPEKVLQKCTGLDQIYQQTCFESTGLINVMNHHDDISGLLSACSLSENNLIDSCLIGELKELLFEGQNPQVAKSLCGYVSSANSQSCADLFNQLFSEYQKRFGQKQVI